MSDPSSRPTQPLTEGPCQPVYVHAYGLDRETWEKLFDRVADAAHALDESVSCSGGDVCALCTEEPTREELSAEVDRLRAQSAAIKAVADRMAPHAENMCRIGELEIGVPLRAAVRDILTALGLDQDGRGQTNG